MTTKHAPGPWEWSENLLVSQTKPHDVVVRMHATFRPLSADAALIAAAPDLLAVCEGLVAWWKADGISGNSATDALADAARAAVAKAKGTKP